DVVLAGIESPDAIYPAIVGLTAARRDELSHALRVLKAHQPDHDARHRVAQFVGYGARYHAATRHAEHDAFDLLPCGELKGSPRLEWTPLAVSKAHIARLRDTDVVASRRQVGEIENAGFVGLAGTPPGL